MSEANRYCADGSKDLKVSAADPSCHMRCVVHDVELAAERAAREQAERERDEEYARRKFMQVIGRYLGWGLVGPNEEPGVACYVENADAPYVHAKFVALGKGEDVERLEREAIDKARFDVTERICDGETRRASILKLL